MAGRKASGFSEEKAAYKGTKKASAEPVRCRLKLGPGGRIVIPAEIRETMGIEEGSTLLARCEDGELTLSTTEAVVRRVQAAFRKYVPEGVSVVDELIADRRREAAREQEDG